MEELHQIHKAVPYGYWVLWVEPAYRHLVRRWRRRRSRPAVEHTDHDQLIALR